MPDVLDLPDQQVDAFGRPVLARRRRETIADLGEWASWSTEHSTLLAYGRGRYVSAIVQLGGAPEQTRRDLAIAFARQIL